uniref:OBG-type G domain-containing protein n=1 Tax=Phaeomonas parva TaxID=124430 RepID=A0A6U4LAH9_9STRA|mmetsp:Transcript_6394/g.17988  ORF Transcript_6394/g.17988 Transcript_6394/m.17988 type:complete len:377 (+) Transcript_6394:153-1283(+)
MSTQQKIADLEAEYARTQKNKATAGHLGLIKAKLAKLKRELLEPEKSGGSQGGGTGFDVSKAGDTRVGLVGFPSVGKSTLMSTLTGTFSEAAAYEFTTLTAIPGTLTYRGAKIQILDLPGIIEGARDGKGRGRQVIGTARTCNLILIVLDAAKPMSHKNKIEHELDGFGIRLNKQPPNITFRKKERGGMGYTELVPQTKGMNREVARQVLQEYRMPNSDILMRGDHTVDEFIDVVEGVAAPKRARKYIPAIYCLNMIDQLTIEDLTIISQMPHHCPISSRHRWNLFQDGLVDMIWDYCSMIRIYTKPKGQIPDLTSPVILHNRNPTVAAFCNRIHRGILPQFKHAWVWGTSVKHQPQRVGKDHVLNDEDVVQIVKQ